jgi:hypothetical protein
MKTHEIQLARAEEVQRTQADEEYKLIMTEEGAAINEAIRLVVQIAGEMANLGHKAFVIYIYSEPNIGTRPSANGWRVVLAMLTKAKYTIKPSAARQYNGSRLVHRICGLRVIKREENTPLSKRCHTLRPDAVYHVNI